MLKEKNNELTFDIKGPLEKILGKVRVHFDSTDCCDDALQAFQLGDRKELAAELTGKTVFTHEMRAPELARVPCCTKHGQMYQANDRNPQSSDGERYIGKPILVTIDITSLDSAERNMFVARFERYFESMNSRSILKTKMLG